jgi:2-aminophenol/2-amino-5-chlorophenol 1,6-dioxygenase alpha subunit
MRGTLVGAGIAPGLPHLLATEKSDACKRLASAYGDLEQAIAKREPDALMVYSTQWLSVLGTSYQVREHLSGEHVDENWHELGALGFDFHSDVALSKAMAAEAAKRKFPTKLIDYEEFPIDTGAIVALSLLNGELKRPVSLMSCWVYADAEKNRELGAAAREAVLGCGERVFALAVTSLSQRYFTHEITPAEDKISDDGDEGRNQEILRALETGNLQAVGDLVQAAAGKGPFDMGGAAFHWLTGVCGGDVEAAKVLAYGPIWGTGNAVAQLVLKN